MEQDIFENNLKERLILAGLKELEEHGIKNFSLRRVANTAEVSCAAPYRHFKNKDQLILAILEYIRDDWFLLCRQIEGIFNSNLKDLIKEMATLCVKFWVANGNFLSVLFLIQSSTDPLQKKVLCDFDIPIQNAIKNYLVNSNLNYDINEVEFEICSIIYGNIMLITKGAITIDNAIIFIKNRIENILK